MLFSFIFIESDRVINVSILSNFFPFMFPFLNWEYSAELSSYQSFKVYTLWKILINMCTV